MKRLWEKRGGNPVYVVGKAFSEEMTFEWSSEGPTGNTQIKKWEGHFKRPMQQNGRETGYVEKEIRSF